MSASRRTRSGRLLAAAAAACALAAAFSPVATASNRPESYDAAAEAAAFRVRVVKPAALPTSDEFATLAIPFARAETSSSPLGRAIGSWLWPGETVADVKSLGLVGLDPGADETACADRQAGRDTPRTLAAIPNPAGGEIAIPDPSDNPCGSASFKQIFAGQIDSDAGSPTRGQRTGGLIRALPDYPFWSVAQYPSSSEADESDRTVLCQAPGAIPEEPWHTPREACPPGGAPDAGMAAAFASADRNAAQSTVADLALGPIAARAVSAIASTDWNGGTLIATTSVQIDDLRIASADPSVPMLTIGSLRSTATASSDGRLTGGSLQLAGVRVALAGLPASMPCSAAAPCEASIGRDGVTVADASVPAELRDALDQALTMLAVSIPSEPADAAGQTVAAGGAAAGPAVAIAPDRRAARVAGIRIDLAADNSLEGRTLVSLDVGGAAAAAVARFGEALDVGGGARIDDDFGAGPVGGGSGSIGGVPAGDAPRPDASPLRPPLGTRAVGASPIPASQPIPPALALLVFVAILAGTAGLVAFGIWETAP